MQDRTVSVERLSMTYRAPVRESRLTRGYALFRQREFREVQAVRDVSFSIDEGELVGFIGPNGAGKTTTLKLLSGVLYPTAVLPACLVRPAQARPTLLAPDRHDPRQSPIGCCRRINRARCVALSTTDLRRERARLQTKS